MSAADIQRLAAGRHPNLVRTLFVATEPPSRRADLPRDVERILGELEERLLVERATVNGHTLFVARPQGYALRELDGPPPPVGAVITLDAERYLVVAHRPSPFPDDRRRCAVVEPA